VFLGTLYPLFLDALGLGKISVGPPYFDAVFAPLMIPVLLLMAIGPFVRWKEASWRDVLRNLRSIAALTLVLSLSVAVFLGTSPMVACGLAIALWVLLATGWQLAQRLRHAPAGTPLSKRFGGLPRSYWGMIIAHAGIGVFVIGATLAKGAGTASDMSMQVGDTATAGGYSFRFTELSEANGPNYTATRAVFDVSRDGKHIAIMKPEKRLYTVKNMPMTEAAIDRGFTRDLYISMGESLNKTTWLVRVQHKPFMSWIWAGCIIMALGGLMAALDRRYRRLAQRQREAAPVMVRPALVLAGEGQP
jgi:cytochrome c-type biogenesis protein CcmF